MTVWFPAEAMQAAATDTYLMTDSVEDRLEIPAHTDDPIARYNRLVGRVEQQRTVYVVWMEAVVLC